MSPISVIVRRRVFLEQKLGFVPIGVGHGDSTPEMPHQRSGPVQKSDERTGNQTD